LLSRKALLFFVVLALPISVSAGLFSTLSSLILGNSEDKSLVPEMSPQKMSLLAAVSVPGSQNAEGPTMEKDALVPDVGPSGSAADISLHKPSSDQISIYVVREGDTLSQIAQMFDVSVNTIKWGNDLPSNTLRAGQTLVILPISGVKHTVAKGDSLKSIAKKYNGDIDEIVAFNDLDGSEPLAVGSVIIIPDGEVSAPVVSRPSSQGGSSSGLKEYSGYYLRPVAGGRRSQGFHGHNGIDIAAPVGTEILASADGEVIISRTGGWNGGYGNYIVIRHSNGTQTLYSHNSTNLVSAGESVKQGQVIGLVGRTGKATGPHLHFEIRGGKNPF
jgi:LysM repeat protein